MGTRRAAITPELVQEIFGSPEDVEIIGLIPGERNPLDLLIVAIKGP